MKKKFCIIYLLSCSLALYLIFDHPAAALGSFMLMFLAVFLIFD